MAAKNHFLHPRGSLIKTLTWLRRIAERHDRVMVGFSGGKDSLNVLDLCIRAWEHTETNPRVEAYALHFLPGLECFDRNIDYAERRFKIRIHRVQHWLTANAIRIGTYRPHIKEVIKGAKRLPRLSMNDVLTKVRTDSGIDLIATGEHCDDSLHRRGQLSKHMHASEKIDWLCRAANSSDKATSTTVPLGAVPLGACYAEKERRIFPLWDWSVRDTISYLRARKIPIPYDFGRINMSGISLAKEDLAPIREHFPQDYAKILEVFPYAEAVFKRDEFLAKREAEKRAATENDVNSGDDNL